ncbi:MAG: 30S ribosomal protein S4, partial [Candidatus Sulfotelmatobacter sp.]
FAPGQHGKDRKAKIVGYGLQLREKQKAKRIYFTQEGQFRNYFEKAVRAKGVTGERLLQQLERRLDNVVFRLGFAQSRRQARQLVRHGHVAVNGRKVNIPSFQVNVGQEIAIRENSKKLAVLELAKEFSSHGTLVSWLEVDRDNYKAKVLNLPKREDIQLPVNEQLIVELYSK